MKMQPSHIREHDLDTKNPFQSFLNSYNQFVKKVFSILNRGILIHDNLAHQIELIHTSHDEIRFPKRISHEPILVLLIQAKRHDMQTKRRSISIREWTIKQNTVYVTLEGMERTLHHFTFLIL